MKELVIDAVIDNLDEVLAFVDENLDEMSCPARIRTQMDIAAEEIFVNIASYAYTNGTGYARICFEPHGDPRAVTFVFEDEGIMFDPLAKEDPDTTLSAEDRAIGGLGIYMVKKSMDDVSYEYKDGKNILKLYKKL